jgi:hypothetical protein
MEKSAVEMSEVSFRAMMQFLPVVDNECFTDDLLAMMNSKNFHTEVDLMAGVMEVEGLMFAELFFPTQFAELNETTFR